MREVHRFLGSDTGGQPTAHSHRRPSVPVASQGAWMGTGYYWGTGDTAQGQLDGPVALRTYSWVRRQVGVRGGGRLTRTAWKVRVLQNTVKLSQANCSHHYVQ